MNIREAVLEDKADWNEFVAENSSFLQCWEWGDVQKELKVPFWRYIVEDEGIKAVALVVKHRLPLGFSWLYVPRGPVLKEKSAWSLLEEKLTTLAKHEKAMFTRIDPPLEKFSLPSGALKKANREVQPRYTMISDLTVPAEKMLAGMHSKTRYNIRLAERKGVKISFSRDIKDLEYFLQLTREVSNRSDFRFHPDGYYRAMGRKLIPAGKLEIALASYEDKVVASHIIIKSGDTATYAHGASSSGYRNVMAPYILQWETLKKVQKEGYKYYDWFGVAPEGVGPGHPWSGITKFKTGFGGSRVSYMGAYDLVRNPFLYKGFNMVRKLLRK